MSSSKFYQQFIAQLNKRPQAKLALQLSASALIPAVPILYWSHTAKREREERRHQVSTKLRIPNVQTIDDLLVEKCQPGDVILFDRRCECCASGPVAALGCLLGKAILCDEDDGTRSVERGSYEHCGRITILSLYSTSFLTLTSTTAIGHPTGIVVPGLSNAPGAKHDPSNLCLLEATSGSGIVCRPLLTRLEMSRSRSVILLPLSCPGERRFAVDHGEDDDVEHYEKQHSFLSIMGTFMYLTKLYPTFPIPISPSAWLVVQALQDCGAAMKLNEKQAQETRVEDFTRDGRFFEKDTVRLRPGWKFLSPVVMRETSVS
ncbi:hypothetical protein HJC23_006763 [Cyclotella cryptica]|uniref:Uncharacterized protein n=1 Tax=Cyclotella cryptica TaxID=29204 RepID=A0ABD3NK82_9STRA